MAAPAGGGFDPDAQAYIDAVVAAGGTLSSPQEDAINTFYVDLKSNSLYTKVDEMWMIFGGTQTSSGLRGINPAGTGFTWTANWTFSNSTGAVKTAQASTTADTNFSNSNLTLGNRHYALYCSKNNGTAGYDFASSENGIICSYGNNTFYALANGTSYPATYTSNTDARGFYITNEIANGTVNGWKNGSKVIADTSISSTLATGNIVFGGKGYPNGEPSFRDYIFCSVGKSFTDGEALIYSNLVNNLQTAFSRNTH